MMYSFTRMMWHHVRSQLAAAAFLLASAAVVFGQSAPPTMPDKTVYGRLGAGTGSGPGQAIPLTTLGNILSSSGYSSNRIKLSNGTTQFYADSSGTGCGGSGCSDSNNGTSTLTAFKTVQGALYGILSAYDFTCNNSGQGIAKINLLSNEVNAGFPIHFGPHDFVGACAGGSVVIDGGNNTLEYDGGTGPIEAFFGPVFQLQNIKLVNTVAVCINEFEHASVRIGSGVVFGNCGIGVQLAGGSIITFLNNFTISTNTTEAVFLTSNDNSIAVFNSGITVTFSNAVTYSVAVLAAQNGGLINLEGGTSWSGGGNVSGAAYSATTGSIITGGSSSIPGSAGTSISGAIVDSTFGATSIASGACGASTNGTIAGTNRSGLIAIGSAGTTTCTVSFSTTITAPGACVVFPANATAAATGTTVARVSSVSTTNFVITGSALASSNYYYICL